jgi:hypothetical protein
MCVDKYIISDVDFLSSSIFHRSFIAPFVDSLRHHPTLSRTLMSLFHAFLPPSPIMDRRAVHDADFVDLLSAHLECYNCISEFSFLPIFIPVMMPIVLDDRSRPARSMGAVAFDFPNWAIHCYAKVFNYANIRGRCFNRHSIRLGQTRQSGLIQSTCHRFWVIDLDGDGSVHLADTIGFAGLIDPAGTS